MKPFIAVAGLIGAGKSTLTKQLARNLDLPEYREPVAENPYLQLFYKDMDRWSFPMQIFLLNERFKQHQEVIWRGEGGVQDRSIYEDTIFASILYENDYMCKLDYTTYISLFLNMTKFLQRPDTILYLDVSPEIALERIKQRARGAEVGISIEYLKSLREGYEFFYSEMKDILNIVKLDWTTYQSVDEVKKNIICPNPRWGKHL